MKAPRRTSPGATRTAPWLVLALGLVVAANTGLSALRSSARASELGLGIALFAGAALVARGLRRGARWAWWLSLLAAVVGLFFVLPVVGAVLFGGPLEPVGTGWDVILFPLSAAILVALLVVLWARPNAARPPGDSTVEDS
jgi:peptidoglycan/LPS O-acetylase OafA/YrhL